MSEPTIQECQEAQEDLRAWADDAVNEYNATLVQPFTDEQKEIWNQGILDHYEKMEKIETAPEEPKLYQRNGPRRPGYCFYCQKRSAQLDKHFCSEMCNARYRVWFENQRHDHKCWYHWSWDEDGGKRRGIRSWFYFGRKHLQIEAYWRADHLHAYVEFDPDGHKVSFAIPPFAIWITWESWPNRFKESRKTGLTYFEHSLNWNIWNDDNSWTNHRTKPFWQRVLMQIQRGHVDFADLIFGQISRQEHTTKEGNIDIVFENKDGTKENYSGTYRLYYVQWKRSRHWGTRTTILGQINIPSGIPVPGKGTESYNCGPDAIYSLTTSAYTVEELAQKLVENVIETRKRYG